MKEIDMNVSGWYSYATALQRAIEYHCNGKIIPESVLQHCYHHANMLNDKLTNKRKAKVMEKEDE